jgi:hypothetical protein
VYSRLPEGGEKRNPRFKNFRLGCTNDYESPATTQGLVLKDVCMAGWVTRLYLKRLAACSVPIFQLHPGSVFPKGHLPSLFTYEPPIDEQLGRLSTSNWAAVSRHLRNQGARYTRGVINTKRWYFPLCILLGTCFGVFVLPFLLPPPYLAGISAANVAGFNNKVASLAAAALGTLVCFAAFRWPQRKLVRREGDFGRLPKWLVLTTVILCGCMVALLSYLIAISGQHYGDGRYFIRQISMYVEYGRRLYDQIELPYGPLLFYGPAIVHAILSPLHASTATAYYTTLVLEQVIGLLLVAYVLDRLPILRRWKIVFLLLCLLHTYPFGFGLNYTFLRFAFLVLAARQTKPWAFGGCLFAGQAASLALSPEMGFAFGASSIAYATYYFFTAGRAWLVAVVAPFAATVAFLLLAGAGYLRMLKLFARGIANFVVEPIPYILVFLFALVWLVPLILARFFREARPEAPLLAALYVFSVAMLPVAFGRADPGHVFFSGIGIYLLSLVAISDLRTYQQVAWVTCVVLVLMWTAFVDDHFYWRALRARIDYDTSHWQHDGLMRAHMLSRRNFLPLPKSAFFLQTLAILRTMSPLISRACRQSSVTIRWRSR